MASAVPTAYLTEYNAFYIAVFAHIDSREKVLPRGLFALRNVVPNFFFGHVGCFFSPLSTTLLEGLLISVEVHVGVVEVGYANLCHNVEKLFGGLLL